MTPENGENQDGILPDGGNSGKIIRGLLQIGGAIPIAGGVLSAVAGAWSEHDQERINRIIEEYLMRIKDEVGEQKKTLAEIIARLDPNEPEVRERFESEEYQALLKKAFRNWSEIDSEDKRIFIRNLLANAAASTVTSDDVTSLFIEWIHKYSTLHFTVIGAIYNASGITRGGIWDKIGKARVREDSAEADLYKLLFHDLSTGHIIRQHRNTNIHGQFMTRPSSSKGAKGTGGPKPMKSAFNREESYELTGLGQQFVHYAMTDLPPKIGFNPNE